MVTTRLATQSDLPFMHDMLYEAIYWRENPNKPTFDEAMQMPDVLMSLADFGKRNGDAGIIAMSDNQPIGAAWYRYWTDENNIYGYIEANMPVVVIAVHEDYRYQDIGKLLMQTLIEQAQAQHIAKISLSVSKDNHALNLYRQQGFIEHTDLKTAFLMVREIS